MITSVFLLLLSGTFIQGAIGLLKSNDRLDDTKAQVAGLEAKKKGLEQDIAYKQTEEYLEAKARNDLNFVKPNEKVYVVVDAKKLSETPSTPDVLSASSKRSSDIEKGSAQEKNWYMWYRLFF